MEEFHPLTAAWFERRFDGATEPQRGAWPAVRSGRDVLISAPTGSGKTLAAFLICLDRLIARGVETGTLDDHTEVVYVSPLKALSTDIANNLEAPLSEIGDLATERGVTLPPIRTAVRTGDTPARERGRMVRRPSHLLVTTPESLDSLRMVRRDAERDGASPVSVPAADPLNLTGIIIPGKRVSALSNGVVEVVGRREAPGHPLEYSGSFRPGQSP